MLRRTFVIGQPRFYPRRDKRCRRTANPCVDRRGVWIQNGKLYIADSQDNRILIYNQIPTTNGVAADQVLGAKDFTTFVQSDIAQQNTDATADNMLNPVAVSSDGTRLFVTDLGYNRVLIWKHHPYREWRSGRCGGGPTGLDEFASQQCVHRYSGHRHHRHHRQGNRRSVHCFPAAPMATAIPLYPALCAATLSFPALRPCPTARVCLFADGGNDRVLVYNTVPIKSGASADAVLGQADFNSVVASDGRQQSDLAAVAGPGGQRSFRHRYL